MILSHYLVTVSAAVLSVAIGMAFAAVASVVRRESTDGLVLSGALLVGALLVVFSVMIPLQVRWGYVTGAFVALAVIMGISGIASLGQAAFGELMASLGGLGPWLGVGLLALGLVGLAVSVLVSMRIYERQDH